MRIAYCTNVRLPNERAHGQQVAKVTQALIDLGHEVEIFAPFRTNPIQQNFSKYYGLMESVTLHHLGSIDGISAWWAPGIIGLKLTTLLFGRMLRTVLKQRSKEFDVVYTRTPELLPYLKHAGIPIILELHRLPRLWLGRFVRSLKDVQLVVTMTNAMRMVLIDAGVSRVPIIAEGDAVDLHDFEELPSVSETRAALGVPDGVPLVGYAGQLQSMGLSKGIPELVDALLALKRRGMDFRAVIAGGPQHAKEEFVAKLPPEIATEVSLLGFMSHDKIPTLLIACDVLVYPAPASKHPFYVRDTSPLKIFEYMAAGRPIVAADLPPIREILDDSTAFFCTPGDKDSLADALREAMVNRDEAAKRAKIARSTVENFTWKKRMERILHIHGAKAA